MNKLLIIITLLAMLACERQVDRSNMLGNDIRLFQDTPAWELAQAVEEQDTLKIEKLIINEKVSIDFQEPKFGNTLLMWAVSKNHYYSASALLINGADPNLPDNYDGETALMNSCSYGPDYDTSTRMLNLLLDHGGNPNSIEQGERREGNWTRNTPLIIAAGCCLEKTKILVNAGADINFENESNESALKSASLGGKDCDKILKYLLIEKEADVSSFYAEDIDGNIQSLSSWLRSWTFPLDSEEYKIKMEIVNFLIAKGDNYWDTSVPKQYYKNYTKEYLEKY